MGEVYQKMLVRSMKNVLPSQEKMIKMIIKHFGYKDFSRGEYSNAVGEEITSMSLSTLVKKGFLEKIPDCAVPRYKYTGKKLDKSN